MSLTDEDKQWFHNQFAAIDERLDALDAKFGESIDALDRRLNALEAKFGERLNALEAKFGERLNAVEAKFGERLNAVEAAIDERLDALNAKIERVETSLLTAFHQWASPLETRVRSHSLALRALDQDNENTIERDKKLADFEARLRKLERAS